MTLTNSRGYSDEECGFSGAYGWFKHIAYPGKWLVTCYEVTFAKETTCFAITDDFGNLVRVPS